MEGLTAPLIGNREDDKPVPYTYDEYRHIESGTQIQVWKVGMDRPITDPALVRLDYGCPCMQAGFTQHLLGHDCAAQRNLTFQTISNLGIGAIATISEPTAAGNGHGSHAVMQQATIQYEAAMKGEQIPSMQEAYSEIGYYDDLRRHNWVASALAHSVGTERPVIPTTSNAEKVAELQNAGLNIMNNVRIELVSHHVGQSQAVAASRRQGNYFPQEQTFKPGAYLVMKTDTTPIHTRLTVDSYTTLLHAHKVASERFSHQRRIVN